MKCRILHESRGRMRVHLCGGRMTLHEADVLEFCLCACEGVTEVRVFDRTADAVIMYDDGGRVAVIRALAAFSFEKAEAKGLIPEHTSRALNREYEDKLASAVMCRIISKTLLRRRFGVVARKAVGRGPGCRCRVGVRAAR